MNFGVSQEVKENHTSYGRVRIPWTFPLDLPLGLAGELSEKPGEIWESTCDRLVLHPRRLAMRLSASHHGNGDPPQQFCKGRYCQCAYVKKRQNRLKYL